MRYGPKSKFEIVVAGIFGAVYYGALVIAVAVMVGFPIYKLLIGNFAFFKGEGLLLVLFDVFLVYVAIKVFKFSKPDKKEE